MTFSPACFTDQLACFGSWADPKHSPHFGLSITFVEVNLSLFSPENFIPYITFVAHLCTFISVNCNLTFWFLLFEWFASCGIASILLPSNSSNGWLRNLHPCPVEIVSDIMGWFWVFFIHSSHNVSVINCCYFLWSTCSMSKHQNGLPFSQK